MKPFDELVEDVYNDVSFRGEFTALARLMAAIEPYGLPSSTAVPAADADKSRFMGYYEIREAFVYATTLKMITDPPAIRTSKSGIRLLFSAVCKGLSTQYNLEIDNARQLALAVMARYK